MKKYTMPEIEIIIFDDNSDIVTSSASIQEQGEGDYYHFDDNNFWNM